MKTNITKYTVQEALNRETSFQNYAAVTGDDNDWNSAFVQVSASTDFKDLTGSGAADASPFVDTSIKWTEVTVEEQSANDRHLYIKLNSATNDIIYVPNGSLPITFSGYDITDMWIKTSDVNAQINIIAWR